MLAQLDEDGTILLQDTQGALSTALVAIVDESFMFFGRRGIFLKGDTVTVRMENAVSTLTIALHSGLVKIQLTR